MALSKKEIDCLREKMENPKKVVRCPKCGKYLEYIEYKTGQEVRCPTNGCIKYGIRGI